jgi:hypothetical protein
MFEAINYKDFSIGGFLSLPKHSQDYPVLNQRLFKYRLRFNMVLGGVQGEVLLPFSALGSRLSALGSRLSVLGSRLYGSMVLWFYGSMVLWFYGSMVLWFYGSK